MTGSKHVKSEIVLAKNKSKKNCNREQNRAKKTALMFKSN